MKRARAHAAHYDRRVPHPPPALTRRTLLASSTQLAAVLASAGLLPAPAQAQAPAYLSAAFDARTIAEATRALAASAPVESRDVAITGPDIAEDGALVPVGVSTALPGVRRLLILVEKNPAVLAALTKLVAQFPKLEIDTLVTSNAGIDIIGALDVANPFSANQQMSDTNG